MLWQQSAGAGLMKCDRFVFLADGNIPGSDHTNSSCDAGIGPFPFLSKEVVGGVCVFTVLVIKTQCPAVSGISVASCTYTCYMASRPEGSGVSCRYL